MSSREIDHNSGSASSQAPPPACWNCGGPLGEITPTTFEPGRGAQRGFCRRCRTWTWFDREPDHEPLTH